MPQTARPNTALRSFGLHAAELRQLIESGLAMQALPTAPDAEPFACTAQRHLHQAQRRLQRLQQIFTVVLTDSPLNDSFGPNRARRMALAMRAILIGMLDTHCTTRAMAVPSEDRRAHALLTQYQGDTLRQVDHWLLQIAAFAQPHNHTAQPPLHSRRESLRQHPVGALQAPPVPIALAALVIDSERPLHRYKIPEPMFRPAPVAAAAPSHAGNNTNAIGHLMLGVLLGAFFFGDC